jgi:hypothetical protein
MPDAFSSRVGYRLAGYSLTTFACEHTASRDKAAHYFALVIFNHILIAEDERRVEDTLWRS